MANESLILGNSNWAVKANNLLGYAVGETSGYYVPRELDFTRNSTATYTDENGIIQTASANIARVQDGALLLEPQRTNLVTYSEEFDNAAWIKENATITANSIISPSGLQDADTLTDNTTSGRHRLQSGVISFVSGTTYTYSVFVKKNSSGRFLLINAASGANARAALNLDTLEITNINGTGKVEDYKNGWYRFSVTGTATATSIQATYIQMQNSASDNNYVGDGSSFYVWGAQLEAGSYPTSYIPTTSASVTRVADACYKNSISSLIGQSSGVVFADIVPFQFLDGSYIGISDNASTSNRQIFGFEGQSGNSGTLRFFGWYYGGYGTFYAGQRYKIAMAYANNDFVIYVNGTQVVNQTSGTVTGTLSHFGFDSRVANIQKFQGQVNEAILFTTRLSNTELATLTTL